MWEHKTKWRRTSSWNSRFIDFMAFIAFIAFIAFMAFIAFIAFIAFMAFMGAILGSANCWEFDRGVLERLEPWKQMTRELGWNVTSLLWPQWQWKKWFGLQHAPSPVLPRMERISIHIDSVTQLSISSSRQVFVVSFACARYQWKKTRTRKTDIHSKHCKPFKHQWCKRYTSFQAHKGFALQVLDYTAWQADPMDLHKRLPAMSLEHHKPLKLCQGSERITSSPSLLSWPSSLSLPSWLSSQVPPPQRPSSSTSWFSSLSLPSSPSWPSLPSSPSSPSWPSWEPFWEVRTVESLIEEFWRGLSHENKWHVSSVEMWHLCCDPNGNGKNDLDFNMHHPLSFHAWNGYQFTLTQSHSCQYLPAVRCLVFLLHVLAINEKNTYQKNGYTFQTLQALQAPVMQALRLFSSAQGLCTPSPWLYSLTSRSYGPAQTPPCDVTWAPQTAQALPGQWTNHFIAFIAFMAFIAFIAFMEVVVVVVLPFSVFPFLSASLILCVSTFWVSLCFLVVHRLFPKNKPAETAYK